MKYYLEFADKSGSKEYFPENGAASPIVIDVSNDREAPKAEVEHITSAPLNSQLKVSARVNDPSGIQSVKLRYRRVSQFEDYSSAQMIRDSATGLYEANIPAEFFDGKYDVMYFIEALDTKGNGMIFPDLEVEARGELTGKLKLIASIG